MQSGFTTKHTKYTKRILPNRIGATDGSPSGDSALKTLSHDWHSQNFVFFVFLLNCYD